MLHDAIGRHQASIHEKIDLSRIEFCSSLRPRAVSRLRARFARDEIIKSLRSRRYATSFARNNETYFFSRICKTTKSNSFHRGYFPIYLSYCFCKFDFFLYCLSLISQTTTVVCCAKAATHIRMRTVSKPTRLAYKEHKAGYLHINAPRKDVGNTHFKVFSIASYKEIQVSLRFWSPRCGFRIPGNGFQFFSVELEFWIPIVSRIPDSLSCIPDSKAQDSRFHQQKFPDSDILISFHGGISIFLSLLLILNNTSNSIATLTHILVPVC